MTAPAPRLTVGLPVYNGEHYLAQSLEALLGQTFGDFELVVSDNASTDGTAGICHDFADQDRRVRYVRQPQNIGAAPNHNHVVGLARGDLFKWASGDDLYARDLLRVCVDALDAHPEVVMAHSWTAAVDGNGRVTQALDYPLRTDSPDPAVRLRSMLYGNAGDDGDPVADHGVIRADDCYGVVRTAVMRRVAPHDSYYYADKVWSVDLALQGPFHQHPDWLYFRRDHPERAEHANPTVRSRCANLDPRRADPLRHPVARLYGEYVLGYVRAIGRAPLSVRDRRRCRAVLAGWLASRATRAVDGTRRRAAARPGPSQQDLPRIPVDALVAGRGPAAP
ncbi:glycosyltransferase family 2 protein [Kineosporia sp. A_224]|uniref:glycosyltransferase family 2 protein n=1 Tax=Kineosporia sp. A_224 TaxID=1962180 RepID=UPI000B4B7AA4|nr:glycosyltransferase family 2 protein [Kineosporia sp. A_224]